MEGIRPGAMRGFVILDWYRLRNIEPAPAIILDIGAHVGVVATLARFLYPRARVVALEPNSNNFERLSRNCAGLNIETVQFALWPESGKVQMGGSGISSGVCAFGDGGVPCGNLTTIFSMFSIKENNIPSMVLKMNCEGSESFLMRDATSRRTLLRCQRAMIHTHPKDKKEAEWMLSKEELASTLSLFTKEGPSYGSIVDIAGRPRNNIGPMLYIRKSLLG
jgi:FkbM family methyltransferase